MKNRLFAFALVLLCGAPFDAAAQDTPRVPDNSEPQGFIQEPDLLTRVALFADRHLGKGDLNNGFYWDFGKMIPGAGWISIGPGYRQWFGKDAVLVDGSASFSWKGYKAAQARVELPKFANSRLALGAQLRWVDFSDIDYFGVGPDTPETALTQFGVRATHVVGHATFKPARWFDIDAEIGVLSPTLNRETPLVRTLASVNDPTFMPSQVTLTVDTRNFREHPTSGLLLRASAAHYEDRDSGAFTHQRHEGEVAGFVPMFGERVVLALHGMVVTTPDNGSVPFYLLPSLGGSNSLRSFADYRFHDRHMAMANAELRLAMLTHMDLALFTDAGNVAPRFEDLDLDKRSYGVGLRFHTRRQTFARVDIATGAEGTRVLFRLTDPLAFNRLDRRASVVPSVP